jgi:hypothetical protein
MSQVTYYVALPFVFTDDGVSPGVAVEIGGASNLVLIIRYFNPSKPIFTMSSQSRMPLPALTA